MNSGELLNQLLIDLQSLFRTSFRKKKVTLSQINLISSIPPPDNLKLKFGEITAIFFFF